MPVQPILPTWFATLAPGYEVAYPVQVGDAEIITQGEVFEIKRTGHKTAEITLLHSKTGSFFTNTVAADGRVLLISNVFVPAEGDPLLAQAREQAFAILQGNASRFFDSEYES